MLVGLRNNYMVKKILIFCIVLLLCSCARNKTFLFHGKEIKAEPYGWANQGINKNDSVEYRLCKNNVILSCIFIETLAVPVALTGWELYEPVGLKKNIVQ
jgi:hypothetical protein